MMNFIKNFAHITKRSYFLAKKSMETYFNIDYPTILHGVEVYINDVSYFRITKGRDFLGGCCVYDTNRQFPCILLSEYDIEQPYVKFMIYHEMGHATLHLDKIKNSKEVINDVSIELEADLFAINHSEVSKNDIIAFRDALVKFHSVTFYDKGIKKRIDQLNKYL